VKFYGALGNPTRGSRGFTSCSTWTASSTISVKAESGRAVFFLREHVPGAGTDPVGGKRAQEFRQRLEDRRIPSPALLLQATGTDPICVSEKFSSALFLKYNVSVVLNGHDHFYERIKPQKGIQYFVVGSGGKLRPATSTRAPGLTAKGFRHRPRVHGRGDRWRSDVLQRHFTSRPIVDSGVLTRRK
jgi:hypothetical protein